MQTDFISSLGVVLSIRVKFVTTGDFLPHRSATGIGYASKKTQKWWEI